MPSLEELLHEILSRPTAPFREGHVIASIENILAQGRVPYFIDRAGNLVVGAENERRYKAILRGENSEPLRIFIAHMDHPGFHGARWNAAGELEFRWLGGSPTQHLEGSQVWIAARDAFRATGRVLRAELSSSKKMIEKGVILIEDPVARSRAQQRYPKAGELFGGFRFREPLWQIGDLLYTQAADDLVGCVAIIAAALAFFKKKETSAAPPFIALLTRAEEVGFIGAIAHLEQGWLSRAKRPLLPISLETSRALPGAEIGQGPIVRLGDRFTPFDPGNLRVLSELASAKLPGRHQRRIMDGGSCEASAATVYGLRPIGISVPLGNYHNQGFELGPDSRGALGPSPEFVHLKDVHGLFELCKALLKPGLKWHAPWESQLRHYKKSLRAYSSLLKSEP